MPVNLVFTIDDPAGAYSADYAEILSPVSSLLISVQFRSCYDSVIAKKIGTEYEIP